MSFVGNVLSHAGGVITSTIGTVASGAQVVLGNTSIPLIFQNNTVSPIWIAVHAQFSGGSVHFRHKDGPRMLGIILHKVDRFLLAMFMPMCSILMLMTTIIMYGKVIIFLVVSLMAVVSHGITKVFGCSRCLLIG